MKTRSSTTYSRVKSKQRSIENKAENQNKYFSAELFESLTWSAKSQQKVSIADGQTFSDSIDEKSAGNLNLYYFDAI
jgi:hypothetical protein